MVERVRSVAGDVLLFSSGHLIRVLTARWLGLGPDGGRYFLLNPASLSALELRTQSVPARNSAVE